MNALSPHALIELTLVLGLTLALAFPLGKWTARVLEPGNRPLPLAGLERGIHRLLGVDATHDMTWTAYAGVVVSLTALGTLLLYALLRLQGVLPLNGDGLGGLAPLLALNTAISFATNTNWQAYGGESTMSTLTQAIGLTMQNFLSAAVGTAVLAALVRGLVRRQTRMLGNAWADIVRITLYLLLPLSFVLALLLVWQGVPQTVEASRQVTTVEATVAEATVLNDSTAHGQQIPLGMVASQIAIKQLGTNGGGFYNANSAHPLENPTPLSNLLQVVSIILLPAALCVAFGHLVGDRRQGTAILSAMTIILIACALPTIAAEQIGTPRLHDAGVMMQADAMQSGGNMEGKEVRYGTASSAIWSVVTTAASNGSVNAMHDSFTPLGGLFPMWLMQLGEVVFGGVGSGLYGMLVFVMLAIFLAGLMVGRTPEYLGKKIEARDIKLAALVVLLPSAFVLIGTAASLGTAAGQAGIFNRGAHGLSEVLYALSSAANNNGSAFGGLGGNATWYNLLLGIAMWIGRLFVIVPVLALAGSMANKRAVAPGPGTLPTTGPVFVVLIIGTVLLVGALTFIPALALGPIAEQLQLQSQLQSHAQLVGGV
ncbi:MAG: potassium-transporting ATPase subunit KdpA [Gemmatimonadaceae bacterium]|nr:potassium-transporting ATPase subunit KdpA [Gemmatimonadaceae bacterium]